MPWEQETRGFWWPSSQSAWLSMLPHGTMFHSLSVVSINLLFVTSSLTFVCYVLKEVTHLKAKVRLSYLTSFPGPHRTPYHEVLGCHRPEDEGSANHNPSLWKVGAKVHLSCIRVDHCRNHCRTWNHSQTAHSFWAHTHHIAVAPLRRNNHNSASTGSC